MNVFLLFILLSGFNSGGIFHLFFSDESMTKKENAKKENPANSGKLKISVGAGVSYGFKEIYENNDINLGFNLGCFIHYKMGDDISLETTINYGYYKASSTQYDYTYGMLEILIGINYEIFSQVNILGGTGIYTIMFTEFDKIEKKSDSSEKSLGGWSGISYSLSESFSLRTTLHLPDFDPDAFYLRLNAVYSFSF